MKIYPSIFSLLCLLMMACSQRELSETTWEQAIQDLYAPESIADISLPCTKIYTSYDRTGGNNDYSNGYKNLGDGWLELADFKGPGVLTRFWFTGIKREVRFHFFFDDEAEPRLKTTCDELYGDDSPFPDQLTSTDQNCYYSGFSIPYGKRLRVQMSDEGYSQGKGKLYFQINATHLKNRTVQSATFPIPDQVDAAISKVRGELPGPQGAAEQLELEAFELSAGASQDIISIEGAGIIRRPFRGRECRSCENGRSPVQCASLSRCLKRPVRC